MEALYRTVATTLRDRITSGQYPVGTKLPTIESVCEELDASGSTVRTAFRVLAEEGLIESRRGIGTLIKAKPATGTDLAAVIDELKSTHAKQAQAIATLENLLAEQRRT